STLPFPELLALHAPPARNPAVAHHDHALGPGLHGAEIRHGRDGPAHLRGGTLYARYPRHPAAGVLGAASPQARDLPSRPGPDGDPLPVLLRRGLFAAGR